MFESGFLEMLLIGVIALLVVGPERLPRIARKAGEWLGKIRRFIASSKQDLERELRTEEMRNMLIMQEEKIRELQDSIKQTGDDAQKELDDVSEALKAGNVQRPSPSQHSADTQQDQPTTVSNKHE